MKSDNPNNKKKGSKLQWPQFLINNPIINQPFLGNVAVVALGPIFSQALSALLSPVYSRIYSPEEFGAVGVFLSLLAVLVPIANLSLSYAIILPRRDKDSITILNLNLIFSLILSAIILIVILLFKDPISRILNFQDYAGFLYFLPLALFFSTASIAYDEWLVRKKKFKNSSIVTICQSGVTNAVQLGMGFLTPAYASLIGVNIFSRGFHTLLAFLFSKKTIQEAKSIDHSPEQPSQPKALLKEYKDFPLFRTPQILLSTLSINLPIILMSGFSGQAVTGLFTFAQRILKLPAIVVADSLGKVFLQKLSESAQKKQSLQPLILKATLLLSGIGAIIFSVIAIFGPVLFSFIFGAEWTEAGVFAQWMSLLVFVSFCSVPVVIAIPILNLQKQYLIFEFFNLLASSIGLIIGFRVLKDNVAAIAISSITSALLTIIWIVLVIIQSNNLNRYQAASDSPQ